MAKGITLERYEKLCLYTQVFSASIMFSIFYENTNFTFGKVLDMHTQFTDVHIFLLCAGVFNLFGMQWAKNKSHQVRLELQEN